MPPHSIVNEAFQAAERGDADALRNLLKSEPSLAGAENDNGLTLLGYAVHFGSADAASALLDAGADVNAISHSSVPYIPSNTALHAAIAGEGSRAVIRLLLERGARTDLTDSNGQTCLHSAAFHDDSIDIIELLIERGADVRARDQDGATPLDLAVRRGNANVAELLRRYGASE